jgi:hypothetical protein
MPGQTSAYGSMYNTVAASQTNQVLTGYSAGKVGDYLAGILVVPTTTGAGSVSITDGSGSAITVFTGGGTLADLKPFYAPLSAYSVSGAWKVTTGANVTAVAIGYFS